LSHLAFIKLISITKYAFRIFGSLEKEETVEEGDN